MARANTRRSSPGKQCLAGSPSITATQSGVSGTTTVTVVGDDSIGYVAGNFSANSVAEAFAMAAVDASGRFAYGAGGGNVTAFTMNSTTGWLTPISGSPFAAVLITLAGLRWILAGSSSTWRTRVPFASVTEPGGVSAHAISPATGGLSQVNGSPFALPSRPSSVTVVAVP